MGILFFAVGLSVFLVRLHHAGPYAFPADGNLRAAILCLMLGVWFSRPWAESTRLARIVNGVVLLASPVILFFALYATLAELEEVVVVHTEKPGGDPVALRLWVMDAEGAEWVNVPRSKALAHGLSKKQVEFLRAGERSCRIATMVEDRRVVLRSHRLGHEKYAVKRLATAIGIFSRALPPEIVSIRLDPCEARTAD